MQINYTGEAFSSLIQLVNYIESTNTLGAGLRWLNRFEAFLQQKLHNPLLVKFCNNYTFRQLTHIAANQTQVVVVAGFQFFSVAVCVLQI